MATTTTATKFLIAVKAQEWTGNGYRYYWWKAGFVTRSKQCQPDDRVKAHLNGHLKTRAYLELLKACRSFNGDIGSTLDVKCGKYNLRIARIE